MNSKIMSLLALLALFAILGIASSFFLSAPGNSTEEELLHTCFDAIRKNDWESFERVAITHADLWKESEGIKQSPFMEKQSYLGGVLKPEQLARLKESFERAAEAGEGQIDFMDANFAGLGTMIAEFEITGFGENSFPGRRYSLRIESDGEEMDTQNLTPQFVIVPWKGKWRILDMDFMDEAEEESGESER